MDLNIDNSKSYATEDNLIKALKKLKFDQFRYLVVRNREGRFTAIFPQALNKYFDGNVTLTARQGFMTVN